jgi:lipid II:glycine glycyltransferase (peptidoglycan interpeptide bridge formation enzyme)
MHQKTRYNVRLAQRRGVTVERATPDGAAVATFYELLEDTARRNEFGVHTATYYQDFLQIFGDDALLLFAVIDQRPVAGLIAARFGPEAVYMYGASSTAHRENAAGFYLQFEAMRWAREQGCLRYDLWGIPATDPPPVASDESDRIPGTRGTDWRGLYQFKVRFGGDIVSYPPTLERRYHPLLSALARRVYRSGG